MDIKLIAMIYELRGMIKSTAGIASEDEQYNYNLIDSIESKIDQITAALEEKMELGNGVVDK